MNKHVLAAAVLSAMTSAPAAFAVEKSTSTSEYEKCYGVAKAQKNDCASKDGKASCAGKSKKDADANSWVYVPAGLCEKLANGVKG
jgi:uncharacterized membrane protein